MSSDLDKRLEELLKALVFDNWHDDGYLPSYKEAIKQAFLDHGYDAHVLNAMTGQEWYDKFEKLVDEMNMEPAIIDAAYLEAAKKAAGIEQ